MTQPYDLDQVRADALQRIERAERKYKFGIVVVALFELACAIAVFCLMDFGNRLHWLLLVLTILIYGTLMICIFSLGEYVNATTQTLLKAILSLRPRDPETR